MMSGPPGETRKQREMLTRQAVADVVRLRLFLRREQQKALAERSEWSCSHLRAILRAEKSCSLFLFLELSRGFDTDPCVLLREVLTRCEALRSHSEDGTYDSIELGLVPGGYQRYIK